MFLSACMSMSRASYLLAEGDGRLSTGKAVTGGRNCFSFFLSLAFLFSFSNFLALSFFLQQEDRALTTLLEAIGNCAYDCIRPAALACSSLDDLR